MVTSTLESNQLGIRNIDESSLIKTLRISVDEFTNRFRDTYSHVTDRIRSLRDRYVAPEGVKEVYQDFVKELDLASTEAISAYLDTEQPEIVLNPQSLHSPSELIKQRAERMGGNCFILFGENHHELGVLGYEHHLLIDLHSGGLEITRVFMEEDESMQPLVDQYLASGDMPTELTEYLTTGFVRVDTTVKHTEKIKLLEAARSVGAQVIFIDENSKSDRDADWFTKIHDRVGEEVRGVNILYAGQNHASRKMGPEPVPNVYGGLAFTRNIGDYLAERYPEHTLHVLGEGMNSKYPAGHIDQTIPGRLFVRELGKQNYPVGRYAIDFRETAVGDFPFSSVPGRTDQVKKEFDILMVTPSEYAFY